jgi:hypothetical protein
MSSSQQGELVFTVKGTQATPLPNIDISSLNFLERQHLQEWVLGQPEIIGDDVLVITFEFDRWSSPSGASPNDRLDVLGITQEGRPVVAELKRGKAPDTVDLQAIKYAAMASRFDEDLLTELHMEFLNRGKQVERQVTLEEAAVDIAQHVTSVITADVLLSPRIVILAEEFSVTVTSSVIWLVEQGLDITLKQYRAYQTTNGETILTVSQFYPVVDVAAFQAAPYSKAHAKTVDNRPVIPWTIDDLAQLAALPFEVPQAVMDLCSQRPGDWIGSSEVYEKAGVTSKSSGMGKLAGFGYSIRKRFERSNPPWQSNWSHGGLPQQYYSVDEATALLWTKVRSDPTSLSAELS